MRRYKPYPHIYEPIIVVIPDNYKPKGRVRRLTPMLKKAREESYELQSM